MSNSAHHRYLTAKWLLVSGLVAIVATVPLAIATWGSAWGGVALFAPLYGLIAIVASTVLGIFNFIALRQGNGRATSDGAE